MFGAHRTHNQGLSGHLSGHWQVSRWAVLLLSKVRDVLEPVLQKVLHQLKVRELSRVSLGWLKRSSIKSACRGDTAILPRRRG